MKKQTLIFSLLSILALTGCGGGSGATKMSEEEFEALVSKITSEGYHVDYTITTKQGGTLTDFSHFEAKTDIATKGIEEYSYDTEGALENGSVLKDLKYYSYSSGAWSFVKNQTEEYATNTITRESVATSVLLFPVSTYSDLSFNSSTGEYILDKEVTVEATIHYTYTYKMDKNSITSVKGTTSTVVGGTTNTQELNVTKALLGSQTIVEPKVDDGKVTEEQFNAAIDFGTIKNFKYTMTFFGSPSITTAVYEQEDNKQKCTIEGESQFLDKSTNPGVVYIPDGHGGYTREEAGEYDYLASENLDLMFQGLEYSQLTWDETNKYYTCNLPSAGEFALKFKDAKIAEGIYLGSSPTSGTIINFSIEDYGEIEVILPE